MATKMEHSKEHSEEHSKEHSKVLVQSNFSPHDVEITGPEAVVAEKKGTDEDQWHMRRMGKLQEMRVWRAQNKGPSNHERRANLVCSETFVLSQFSAFP
jgi:hypothetical protein